MNTKRKYAPCRAARILSNLAGLLATLFSGVNILAEDSVVTAHQSHSRGGTPDWAVPYGQEFWREQTRSDPSPNRAVSNNAVLTGALNLGDIIERVSHAFRAEATGSRPQAAAATYTAMVDAGAIRFLPFRATGATADQPSDAAWPHLTARFGNSEDLAGVESAEAWLKTREVRQGDRAFFAAQPSSAWHILGNTAQRLLNEALGLVEHYEARKEGLSVTWVLASRPSGEGPMVVEAQLEGLSYAGATSHGHHFADATGTARVRVGPVTIVDSSRRRWEVPMEVENELLRVSVPEAIWNQAAYPLAIDPVISPEFGMDQPILAPASSDQLIPAVGSNGTDYLVVWNDLRNAVSPQHHHFYGTRVRADGTVLDPPGFLISKHNGVAVRIASNGKDYLVVWKQDIIRGVRVSSEGVVLDATELALSPHWRHFNNHTLTSNGTDYLLVVSTRPDFGTEDDDVYAVRITSSGAVLDRNGIPISRSRGNQFLDLAAASNGQDYFMVWHDSRHFSTASPTVTLYGARLRADGQLLDPEGLRVTASLRNYPSPLAIASDGSGYLVSWRTAVFDGMLGAAHISADGKVTELDNIESGAEPLSAVAQEPGHYWVLWKGAQGVQATQVGPSSALVRGVPLPASSGSPTLAASNGQGFLLVWSTLARNSPNGWDVFGSLVQGLGDGAQGRNLVVSGLANRQRDPAVVSNRENALVVWEDFREATGSSSRLFALRVGRGGELVEPEGFPITGSGSFLRFDAASNGRDYLVVWLAADGALGGARLSGAGKPLATPFLIGRSSPDLLRPSLAVGSNSSDYLVVWNEARTSSAPAGIRGARVRGDGLVLDPEGLSIATAEESNFATQRAAQVASDGADYLVVWENRPEAAIATTDLHGCRVRGTGEVLDPKGIVISRAPNAQASPTVAFDGSSYLVVWEDFRNTTDNFGDYSWNSDLYGTWVKRDGAVTHPEGLSIVTTPGRQARPALAANGPDYLPGNLFLAWEDGRNGLAQRYDIYGLRITGGGEILDPEGFLIQGSPAEDRWPRLAYLGAGRYLAALQSTRFGTDRVLGRVVSLFEPIQWRNNRPHLAWLAEPGRRYRIEFKDSLSERAWTDVTGEIVAHGGVVRHVDETAGRSPQRFYRLIPIP